MEEHIVYVGSTTEVILVVNQTELTLVESSPEIIIVGSGFAGPQGPQGLQGPQGPQGLQGLVTPESIRSWRFDNMSLGDFAYDTPIILGANFDGVIGSSVAPFPTAAIVTSDPEVSLVSGSPLNTYWVVEPGVISFSAYLEFYEQDTWSITQGGRFYIWAGIWNLDSSGNTLSYEYIVGSSGQYIMSVSHLSVSPPGTSQVRPFLAVYRTAPTAPHWCFGTVQVHKIA